MRSYIEDIKETSAQDVTLTKVMLSLIKEEEVVKFLKSYGVSMSTLNGELSVLLTEEMKNGVRAKRAGMKPEISQSVEDILTQAQLLTPDQKPIDFRMFLYASIQYSNQVSGDTKILIAFEKSGFDFDRYIEEVNQSIAKRQQSSSNLAADGQPKESFIAELCANLNEEAAAGKIDPVIGREDEVLRAIEILAKRKKNNVVLLGRAGVGKTAIAEGLALAIVEGKVPDALKNAVVYSLEVANMVAGTEMRGAFEKKVVEMLKEFRAKEDAGEMPILFIDELHSIVGGGAGGSSGLDFGNIIKPALSRGQLRCIGATTEEEWSKYFNREKALKRRFTSVHVVEPTRAQTIEILKGAKKYYEAKHKVAYSPEALEKCVDLSMEFMPEQALPDKALDLFDLTGSIFKLKNQKEINVDEVEMAIARLKNVAIEAVRSKRSTTVQEPMAPKIKKLLFGQDQAVDKVVKVVEKSIAGLQRPNKPVGAFLFVGPTGVGKTELAKLLAKEMKAHVERIDMSEFMEGHSVSKLIGSPPGYVGFDGQSRLSKMVEKHPRSILLLDEMEKAHGKVIEIFLQAMDNAKITDSQGEEIDFRNILIIMTSNVGAAELAERSIGLQDQSKVVKKINFKAIENAFTPEFRNRLNDVVIFNSLNKDLMVNIVKKSVKFLAEEPLLSRGVVLKITDEAVNWICEKSYDPNMGARPVERFVETHINEVVTQSILYGEILQGKKQVEISLQDGALKFNYV